MSIIKYIISFIACLAIILMAGYSYCLQDRDSDKDYNLARNYGPGWVIPSVLDANGKVKMDESAQKLNDLEKNLSNNPNKDNSSDPALQKKRGAGGGTNKAMPNNVGLQDTMGNILMGTGTDQRDINGALLSESGGKLYSEVINGTRMVYAGFGSDSQEQNAQVIQDAVDYFARHSFTDGGKVLVREGDYTINTTSMNLNGISVYGGYRDDGTRDIEGAASTIINRTNDCAFTISGTNNSLEIDGFTFAAGSFMVNGSANTYTNSGIAIRGASNVSICNNTFGSNIQGEAICLQSSTSILIKNNIMNSNGSINVGINSPGGNRSDISVIGNSINSNHGISILSDPFIHMSNNDFWSYNAISIYNDYGAAGKAEILSENNNYNSSYGNPFYASSDDGGAIISKNDYYGCEPDSIFQLPFGRGGQITTVEDAAYNASPGTGVDADLYTNPIYAPAGNSSPDSALTIARDSVGYYPANLNYSYTLSGLWQDSGMFKTQNNDSYNNNLFSLKITSSELHMIYKTIQSEYINILLKNEDLKNKLGDSYLNTLQGKLDIPINDIATLQDTILTLETKDNKTDTEENLLEVAKLLEENSQYLDDETVKEFNQIARVVEMTEDMKNIMRPGDLQSLSKGLEKLAKEEHLIYNDYLKVTDKVYKKLAALLGINSNDAEKPVKRKFIIDNVLKDLKTKDVSTLTDNQKESLKMDKEILAPLRDEYLSRMKMAITEFAFDVKDLFADKAPATASKDESGMKTLFLLDRGGKTPKTAQ